MTAVLPPPLVPPDCDLRDLPSIMLQRSIVNSELAMMSNGEEFKAAILLYEASYNQQPSGSLPAADRALAILSRAGPKWRKVKPMALRGWTVHSDGRLYHPITAEKVLIAWIARLLHRQKSSKGGAAKNKSTHDDGPLQVQINIALDCLKRVAPDCRELEKWTRRGSA